MSTLFQRPKLSEDKFDRANPENLFNAIFIVLARYQREGKEPGAERWQADTRWYRPKLVNDIRDEWVSLIGSDHILPWHEDYIIDCFVSLRKAQKHIKVAVCEFYGLDVPADWLPTNDVDRPATDR